MPPLSSNKPVKRDLPAVFLVFVLLLCAFSAHAQAAIPMQLFGSKETVSANLQPFTKWTGMLARERQHRQKMRQACRNADCMYDQWERLVKYAATLPVKERLNFINHEVNRSPYIVDPQNWGRDDYWETPYEFFVHSGDCEDYAITKYLMLKEAGIRADHMRIVVLQDYNLNLLHSVLVVRIGEANYILDNQIQQVLQDVSIHHYHPIYSINEVFWWRHMPQ